MLSPELKAPPKTGADSVEPVLLIIADISGYTRYMTANAKTLSHSQTIITELVTTIIHQVELPLEVAKLEGDAVFLFCRKTQDHASWPETRRLVGSKLLLFIQLFQARIAELSASTTCDCRACSSIAKLRLKLIVHSGEALFHRVLNFSELAGVDVILVHRLLKNTVGEDQYLLLTEAAHGDVEFPLALAWVEGREVVADLGAIKTFVHTPDAASLALLAQTLKATNADRTRRDSFPGRFRRSWALYFKLWFAPFHSLRGNRSRAFRNLSNPTSGTGRKLFVLLTALLTPLMLPVGTMFVALQCLQATAEGSAAHPPGCDCGHH